MLAALLVLLSGCGPKINGGADYDKAAPDHAQSGLYYEGETEKLQVVTTIFPPYDFVKQVGGEQVEVSMLLKPGMESHSYEPTPADIVKIMNSDLFLYAGGESDVWVDELLAGNDGHTERFALLDWVDPLEEETAEGMQVKGHDHEHGEHADGQEEHSKEPEGHEDHDGHGDAVHLDGEEYDEHVWTSPKNAIVIVEKICEVLSEKDPAHAAAFEENTAAYVKKLQDLDDAFAETVNAAKRRTIVFGDRFPLLYFVKTYDLNYFAAFPGCSMETEPSAATIAFLTDKVKEEQIPVIFYLEMSNGKIAEAIAETTGAKTAVFYSGHSITAQDLAAGEDYLSLMYRNVDALKEALGVSQEQSKASERFPNK